MMKSFEKAQLKTKWPKDKYPGKGGPYKPESDKAKAIRRRMERLSDDYRRHIGKMLKMVAPEYLEKYTIKMENETNDSQSMSGKMGDMDIMWVMEDSTGSQVYDQLEGEYGYSFSWVALAAMKEPLKTLNDFASKPDELENIPEFRRLLRVFPLLKKPHRKRKAYIKKMIKYLKAYEKERRR